MKNETKKFTLTEYFKYLFYNSSNVYHFTSYIYKVKIIRRCVTITLKCSAVLWCTLVNRLATTVAAAAAHF